MDREGEENNTVIIISLLLEKQARKEIIYVQMRPVKIN